MGGVGSGSWSRSGTKAAVEESFALSVSRFRGQLQQGNGGRVTWNWGQGWQMSVDWGVGELEGRTVLALWWQRGPEEREQVLHLRATPMRFGGQRWWFCCMLRRQGRYCMRLAHKLYLPSGGYVFGCRVCHQLAYRSSQQAHFWERLPSSLDATREWLQERSRREDQD